MTMAGPTHYLASMKNAVRMYDHSRNQTNVNKPKFYSVYTRKK